MTDTRYDRDHWERLWSGVSRKQEGLAVPRPANPLLVEEIADLRPGSALDLGCGDGSDALWLAARVDWVEADLSDWESPPRRRDLVVAIHVHLAGSIQQAVRRMADAVAAEGTLFLVGHQPVDPATGAPTAAAGQKQISVDAALAALNPDHWDLMVAEDRTPRRRGLPGRRRGPRPATRLIDPQP